jgi:hypothetical protein
MALGDNIFAWRKTPLQKSELPALIYRDRTETKGKSAFKEDIRIITLEVEIFAETAEKIRECLADIERSIYTDETWGGLALSTAFNINDVEIEHMEDYFSASRILIDVTFFTVGNDPLTKAT